MFRASIVILSLILFTACADSLFYHPNRTEYLTPAEAGQKYEDVYFLSSDNTKLHGWFVPAEGKAKGTVIHFHGNAQNISAHYSLVAWLPREGYNLFTFDYRGYGRSEGSPERIGIHQDALAAINYVLSRKDVDRDRVFVLGQSLGGAIAIAAVAESGDTGIKGVIIESTFSSYQGIATEKAGEVSSSLKSSPSLLATDDYSPRDYIAKISPIPILLIHGTADRVVPIHHSRELLKLAGEPKSLLVMRGGSHLDAFSRFLSETKPRILAFLQQHLPE